VTKAPGEDPPGDRECARGDDPEGLIGADHLSAEQIEDDDQR
jgi:hypothetical protein